MIATKMTSSLTSYQKIKIIELKLKGFNCTKISKIPFINCSRVSVSKYVNQFKKSNIINIMIFDCLFFSVHYYASPLL